MAEKIKAVIWDMGGVILRTDDWSPRQRLAKVYGLGADQLHEIVFNNESGKRATLGEITEEQHWHNIASRFNLDPAGLHDFKDKFWQGDRLDQDLVDFIRSLKPTHTTALLSNAWSGAREVLAHSKPCIDAFHQVVFSCEIGMAKPEDEIYWHVLHLCQTMPEQAIFVDDAVINIEAANHLGIHGVLFQSTQQVMAEVNALIGRQTG